MEQQFERLNVSITQDVAVIRLDEPNRLNALDQATRVQLAALIREYGSGEVVRGIVITGTGRAFSAGEDLSAGVASNCEELIVAMDRFHDLTRAVLATRVPVIAAVNGIAVGGASEFTLCCDARIGSPAAEFFLPENSRGLTVSNASSFLLQRLIGRHALRMILGSLRVGAEEALSIGLLDEVVAADALIERAIALVHAWTPENNTTALHLGLFRPASSDIEAAIARENATAIAAWESGAINAGVDSFWANKASH